MIDLDLADVRPSVYTWAMVGLMALTFVVLGKFLTTRWYVPGVSEIFAAA